MYNFIVRLTYNCILDEEERGENVDFVTELGKQPQELGCRTESAGIVDKNEDGDQLENDMYELKFIEEMMKN